jgi:FkbM family methyltransferase
VDLSEYERLDPHRFVEFEGHQLIFTTPNRHTAWRVDTLFSKEPDTIEWIAGFAPGDVLLDVGANVGMYSVFAAKTRGVRVYAFEPESQNYAILNRNILLNGLDGLVQAYCVALADEVKVDKLYLSEFVAGSSCHSYGAEIGFDDRPRRSAFAQGCLSSTIDALVSAAAVPAPNHIKVDVDGIEPNVIAGARKTLADSRVRSVLIEINTNLDAHWKIVDEMLELGFDYSADQVERAQRKEGTFKGVGNYVFRR